MFGHHVIACIWWGGASQGPPPGLRGLPGGIWPNTLALVDRGQHCAARTGHYPVRVTVHGEFELQLLGKRSRDFSVFVEINLTSVYTSGPWAYLPLHQCCCSRPPPALGCPLTLVCEIQTHFNPRSMTWTGNQGAEKTKQCQSELL